MQQVVNISCALRAHFYSSAVRSRRPHSVLFTAVDNATSASSTFQHLPASALKPPSLTQQPRPPASPFSWTPSPPWPWPPPPPHLHHEACGRLTGVHPARRVGGTEEKSEARL